MSCGSTQEVIRNVENFVLGRQVFLKVHKDTGIENIIFS